MKTVDFLPYEQFAQLSNAEKDIYVSSKAAELKVGIKNKEYVKIENASPTPQHEYVDLGLPSGTLWATCNLGAETPEETGLYFQWGDISGYTASQIGVDKTFNWANYKYCNGEYNKLTKYCSSGKTDCWDGSGEPDNKLILDQEDDAATSHWGSNWQIPAKADFEELTGNTTMAWDASRSGFTFTANSKELFLPAAGYVDGVGRFSLGSYGNYWSRSLNESAPYSPWKLDFYNSGSYNIYGNARCRGISVRPVRYQNI